MKNLSIISWTILLLLNSYIVIGSQEKLPEICPSNEPYWETWEENADEHTYSTSDAWEITGIAVSPDGSMLAVATRDALHLYDTQSLELVKILESGTEWDTYTQYSLSWSHDNLLLAVARYINTAEIPDPKSGIQIWNVTNGELLYLLPTESETVAWSHDGKFIAVADLHGVLSVWDTETRTQAYVYDAYDIDRVVPDALTWSPNGVLAASDQFAEVLYLWDVNNRDEPGMLQEKLGNYISWSSDGLHLAVGSWVRSDIHILDLSTESIVNTLDGSKGNPFDLQWSPNGDYLARGTQTGLYIWDMRNNITLEPTQYDEKIPEFIRIAWMPDGKSLFSVIFNGSIYKWDIANGCVLASLMPPKA